MRANVVLTLVAEVQMRTVYKMAVAAGRVVFFATISAGDALLHRTLDPITPTPCS